MTYAEKLRDPRWQKKRLEILNRDEFACQVCRDEKTTLHIHHKKYFKSKDPWDIDNEHLITLCKHCHKAISDEIFKGVPFEQIRTLSYTWKDKDRLQFVIAEGRGVGIFEIIDQQEKFKQRYELDPKSIEKFIDILKKAL